MKKQLFSKCLTFVSIFALALTLIFSYGKNFSKVSVSKANAFSVQTVVAEEPGEPVTPTPPTNLGGAVANDSSSNGIDDIYLYQYLLKAYNDYYGLTGTESEAKQIYVEMFSQMTELNLSNANGLIKNVKGLNGYLNIFEGLIRHLFKELRGIDIPALEMQYSPRLTDAV